MTLWAYGERWDPPADPEHQRVYHVDCGHEAIAVSHCSHCGERLSRHNVRIGPPVGALSTGTHGFYASLGWERWRGPTFVDAPGGRTPTPDDDGDIMILRTSRSPRLDLDGAIVCDWRPGDVW